MDVDLDWLRGLVGQRQYPSHDIARQLVGDLAENHDLAPLEQARFQLGDGWLTRFPLFRPRLTGLLWVFVAERRWVMAHMASSSMSRNYRDGPVIWDMFAVNVAVFAPASVPDNRLLS
jgi:hypothetical protein